MRLFHSLDNPISRSTFAAARAAVGTSLAAAEDMLEARRARAFVSPVRPAITPSALEAMGFCFFNTIACVAEWLREQPGIERVFIFDFDVHHGNGTQHLFEERDDVFYASMHRYPFYPGTGARTRSASAQGRGFTKNIPLDAGDGDVAVSRAVEDEIVRIIDDYRPNAILLSVRLRRPPPRPPRRHARHGAARTARSRGASSSRRRHCAGACCRCSRGATTWRGWRRASCEQWAFRSIR